jgi:manganese/zinc/iron transport system substrate-binding protein
MTCNKKISRRAFAAFVTIGVAFAPLPLAAQNFTALATTGMIGDAVKAVVGDTGKVEVLLGTGIDPHSYKPTRADIARLSSANIVFYNGLLLEGKMTDALVRVASAGRPVVAVTEALDEKYLLEP